MTADPKLRAYGNAINAEVACAFIEAYMTAGTAFDAALLKTP